MIKIIHEVIDALKLRIKMNLNLIHNNESKIREILNEPVTEKRSEKLNIRFAYNRKLLQENTNSIKLQKELNAYLENYIQNSEIIVENNKTTKSTPQDDIVKNISKEDYFDLTINNAIEFDNQHPYFRDEAFLNDLLNYFTETEEYEKCFLLINLKKEHSAENSNK